MPTNRITELRKSGKLDEALQLALKEYEDMPELPFTAINLAWVYDAFCKKYAATGNVVQFRESFLKIQDLNVLPSNPTLNDALCWRFLALLKHIAAQTPIEQQKPQIDICFELAKKLTLAKPGEAYSILFQAFYKVRNSWDGYLNFCDWWNLKNFLPQDYACQTLPNGKKMSISLAEGAYIAYARWLLKTKDKERIRLFIPKLQQLNEEYPEMNYPGYYIGKLLLLQGEGNSAINAILPFARKKKREFWIWQLLAQAKKEDKDVSLACLIRAVHSRTQESFLVKVRQELADMLINRQNYKSAKEQINLIIKNKNENHYAIPYEIQQWTREAWFTDSNAIDHNPVSNDYMMITNKILLADVPAYRAVVTFVNRDKNIVNIIYGQERSGFFKIKDTLNNVQPGDIIIVYFKEVTDNGFIKPLLATIDKEPLADCSYYRHITGIVGSNKSNTYFFLKSDNIQAYISSRLMKDQRIFPGISIKATIVYDLNPKKNKWAWKIIKIN